MINEEIADAMIRMAKEARLRAYGPYSKASVGACALTSDGTLYGGCNIENASYGLSCCAERVAVYKAVADSKREFLPAADCGFEEEVVRRLSAGAGDAYHLTKELEQALDAARRISVPAEQGLFYRSRVVPLMASLRAVCDELEHCTAEDCWPFPTYGELLYGVR